MIFFGMDQTVMDVPRHQYRNYRALNKKNLKFPGYAEYAQRTCMGPNPYHTARLRADDSVFSHEQRKFTNIGMMASAVLVARELTLRNALNREIDGDWTPIDLALNQGPVITQQRGSGTEVLIAEATVCPDGSAFNP
jgi:hypothetical protein